MESQPTASSQPRRPSQSSTQQLVDLSDPATCDSYFTELFSDATNVAATSDKNCSSSAATSSTAGSGGGNGGGMSIMSVEYEAERIHLLLLAAPSFHKASQQQQATDGNTNLNINTTSSGRLTAEQAKRYLEACALHLPHALADLMALSSSSSSVACSSTAGRSNGATATTSNTSSSSSSSRIVAMYKIRKEDLIKLFHGIIGAASLCGGNGRRNKHYIIQSGILLAMVQMINNYHYQESLSLPSTTATAPATTGNTVTTPTSRTKSYANTDSPAATSTASAVNDGPSTGVQMTLLFLHTQLIQLSILASHYRFALKFVNRHPNPMHFTSIFPIDSSGGGGGVFDTPSDTSSTKSSKASSSSSSSSNSSYSETFLQYHYYVGLLHLGTSNYRRAMDSFSICLKVPSRGNSSSRRGGGGGSASGSGGSQVSAITIAAWKKIVLIRCLLLGVEGEDAETQFLNSSSRRRSNGASSSSVPYIDRGMAMVGATNPTARHLLEFLPSSSSSARVNSNSSSNHPRGMASGGIDSTGGGSISSSTHSMSLSPGLVKYLKQAAELTIQHVEEIHKKDTNNVTKGVNAVEPEEDEEGQKYPTDIPEEEDPSQPQQPSSNPLSRRPANTTRMRTNPRILPTVDYSGLVAYYQLVNVMTEEESTYASLLNYIYPDGSSSVDTDTDATMTESTAITTNTTTSSSSTLSVYNLLVKDGNLGLIQQILSSYYIQTVRKIAQVYQALPLVKLYDKLAKAGCFEGAQTVLEEEKKVELVKDLLLKISYFSQTNPSASFSLTSTPLDFTMDMEQSVIYFYDDGDDDCDKEEEEEELQKDLEHRITSSMELAQRVGRLEDSVSVSTKYQMNIVKNDVLAKANSGSQSGEGVGFIDEEAGGGGGIIGGPRSVMDAIPLDFK